MQFRIADLAYPFALFAVSVGAFGVGYGLLLSLLIAALWMAVYRRSRTTCAEWVVLGGLSLVLLLYSLPDFLEGREHSRRVGCCRRLEYVVADLIDEAVAEGRLPQATNYDSQGNPLHSWRVSLLPRVAPYSGDEVYEAYDWTQPWDSPANAHALAEAIDDYSCSSDSLANFKSPKANYFAIVGPQTAWRAGQSVSLAEIADGRDQTILLLEAGALNVAWGEPFDLSFDSAVELLSSSSSAQVVHRDQPRPGAFYRPLAPGVHAAFADGAVRFLPLPLPEEMAKALLTANAGDHVDWEEFERLTAPQLDYAKIYATIAFAFVALWPARRAFHKQSVLAPGSSNRG